MSEIDRQPIEGVVVDDRDRIEDFCQGVVESMTEWDWAELPEPLRDGLRTWARGFFAWWRETEEGEAK